MGCSRSVTSPEFLNLSVDAVIPGTEDAAYAWKYYLNRDGYAVKPVTNSEGGKSMFIRRDKDMEQRDTSRIGSFFNWLPAGLVRGKEVEVRCRIKAKAVTKYAGLFISAADSLGKELFRLYPTEETGVRATRDWHEIALKASIPDSAAWFTFGGMMYERGNAWFDDFELYIDGRRLKDNPSLLKEPAKEEIAWLRRYASPVTASEGEAAGDSDLAPITEHAGDASMIAIGGLIRASREADSIKFRIVKNLSRKGFNHIMVGTDYRRAAALNDYVNKGAEGLGAANPNQYLYPPVYKWARDEAKEGRPVYFSGYNLSMMSLDIFKDTFAGNSEVERTIKVLEEEYGKARDRGYRLQLSEDEINGFFMLASPLYEAILKVDDAEKRSVLLHSYRLFEQAITINQSNFVPFMVENMLWNLRQHKGSKPIIWGYNFFVNKTGNPIYPVLADSLSARILTIGFAIGTDSIPGGGGYTNEKQPSSAFPGSFEYYFSQLGEPAVIINLRAAREDPSPQGDWLRKRLFFRRGADYGFSSDFNAANLTEDFDYLIFIR